MNTKRPYRLKERAKSRDETRQKIVEATMHLHEEIGPRATTISAIAERAGVQRLTVYRHFPDETAVFQACTAHWLGLNPPPDPSSWASVEDPMDRLRAALAALYAYYSRTRRMWDASHRDVDEVEALKGPMQAFAEHIRALAGDLAAAFHAGDAGGMVAATVRHAAVFPTWSGLEKAGLDDAAKVDLAAAWVAGALETERAS